MTDLRALSREAFEAAASHGFWEQLPGPDRPLDYSNYINTKLMLIVGEVAEAHEELRAGHTPYETYYREDGKPEGMPSELADVVIRVMDLAEACGIDLDAAVVAKMKFNASRPFKHGKKF